MEPLPNNEHIYVGDNEVTFRRDAAPQERPRPNSEEISKTTSNQIGEAAISKMKSKLRIIFSVTVVFFIVILAVFGVQFDWISRLDTQTIEQKHQQSRDFERIDQLENLTRILERNLINMRTEQEDQQSRNLKLIEESKNITRRSEQNLINIMKEQEDRQSTNLELIKELKNMTRLSQQNLINMMKELNDATRNDTRTSKENLIGMINNMTVGSIEHPASNCNEIKGVDENVGNGLYYLRDMEGNVFQTYCDFNTTGGGWTLVASVHENNMKGRCTAGDRWSSEQGNNANHPDGDGFWENRATYGSATSAASDDYKNSGYFAMNATDIMIWQLPNDTPLADFDSRAFLKYRTSNEFLTQFGGNLASLFSLHYNLKSKKYRANLDNGPSVPITWEVGSNEFLMSLYGPSIQGEVDAGYIQFRAINYEQDAFAMCPGVKIKLAKVNVEHACIGSTSNSPEIEYCGDYGWRDIDDPRWIGYQLNQRLIDSVVMIFYR